MFTNESFYKLQKGISTRWASPENIKAEKGNGGRELMGRKGSPFLSLEAGDSMVLAEENGVSGTIRRIWATIEETNMNNILLRGLKLYFYWDGSDKPAASVPFGDFFGQSLGRMAAFESAFFSSPEGRSFNCYIPMPFKTGMKIVLSNESSEKLIRIFYDVDYTIGDNHGEDVLYFHACYHRENPTTEKKDFEILTEIKGKGGFLGCNIGVSVDTEYYSTSWWGEGEVKIYLDGDKEFPTLCGTGTEDFIGTGWGQGRSSHLYQGCTIADEKKMEYCFYRYHIVDPVYFSSDIRVTIQQMGCCGPMEKMYFHYNGIPVYSTENVLLDLSKTGDTPFNIIFEMHYDISSCCYFYLDRKD